MSEDRSVSRRDLLRRSVTAGLAAGIPVSVARAAQAAEDPKAAAADAAKAAAKLQPVRIGWIGTGTQGRNDLSKLLRMPGVEIVAIADIYQPNYDLGLKMAGPKCKGYKDYRKMLEQKDIDAVGIATPLYLHAPMAIDSLNAGKHVYVEKMMAYTVDAAREMIRTADRTGRLMQVGHQRRYSVEYHHALSLLKKDTFGQITQVRAQWNRRNNWRRPVPDPSLDRLLNWRLYNEYSRGLMAELGSHQIDVTNWFLDQHPIAVVGVGGIDYWKDGREVYDNVQVIYEYPGGQKLIYQSHEMNEFDGFSETFYGRKGTLITSEMKGGSMMFQEKGAEEFDFAKFSQNKEKVNGRTAIKLDAGATTSQDKRSRTAGQTLASKDAASKDNWFLSLEDFVDCVRTGRKPFCDGRVGMADVACVVAANEAMQRGTRVLITDEMMHV